MKQPKVVIVGAGPGGLLAASEAARGGAQVTVLEKNKTYHRKPCAEAVTGKTLARFPFLYPAVERMFSEAKIISYDRTARFKRRAPFLIAIDRAKLDQVQSQQATVAGAEILYGKKVVEIRKKEVLTKSGESYCFDYLIGADGGLSVVRKHLGIPTVFFGAAVQYRIPTETNELVFCLDPRRFEHTYAWSFPHRGYTSVGTGFSRVQKASIFVGQLKRFCQELGLDWRTSQLEGGMVNTDFRGYRFGNIFLVGEASGLVSGLTGEGIYNALLMGKEISRQITTGSRSSRPIEERMSKKRLHEILIRAYYTWPGFCAVFYRFSPELKVFKE